MQMYAEIRNRQMLIIGTTREELEVSKMLRFRGKLWDSDEPRYNPIKLGTLLFILILFTSAAASGFSSQIPMWVLAAMSLAVAIWWVSLFFRAYGHTRLYRHMKREGRVIDLIDSSAGRPFINEILFDKDDERELSGASRRHVLFQCDVAMIEGFLLDRENLKLLYQIEGVDTQKAARAKAELVRRAKRIIDNVESIARPCREIDRQERLGKLELDLGANLLAREEAKEKLAQLETMHVELSQKISELRRLLGEAVK